MSFAGDAIANAVISAEVVVNPAQVAAAGRTAAEQINRAFNVGAGTGAVQAANVINNRLSAVRSTINNVQAGFTTLAQVISSRIPAGVTRAAAAISGRLGQAFGAVHQSVTRLSAAASSAWNSISSGAQAAAIATGALIGITATIVKNFAELADESIRAETGTRGLASAIGLTSEEATELINKNRELGASLGFNSNELIQTSQRFIAMGSSVQQTTELMDALVTGTARQNATQAQLSRTLTGLQQVQAKGVLSQEELRRQILENIPGLLNQNRLYQLIGESLGITTEAARKLQEEGGVTADVAIPAIQQAIEELNQGVDVLAIRASTLSGAFGILRENFNQIVGTAFRPFIEAIVPIIRDLTAGIQEGTGPFATLRDTIARLGEVAGKAFGDILKEIIPLIAEAFPVFVTLVEAMAPVVTELVKTLASLARILLPVASYTANVLNVLINKLGPVSTIIRQVLAGLLAGGLIKALGLFGRAAGSAGGFIGRIATPLSKFLASLTPLAGRIAGAVTAFGLLRTPIEALVRVVENAIGVFSRFIGTLSRLPGISQTISAVKSLAGAIGGSGEEAEKTGPILGVLLDGVMSNLTKTTDVTTSSLSGLNKTLTEFVDKQEDLVQAANRVKDAEAGLADAHRERADAIQGLADAHVDLQDAQQKLIDIDEELTELEAERQTLINDTARDIRELAEAERDLARINLRLLGIDRDRAEILAEIAELSRPATAQEIAEAENDITRATIAHNRAIRAKAEYLAELNAQQQTSLDLTNLSLDDLRTTLSGLRAQAAAQRSTGREVKSQAEIDEDIAELTIDIFDTQTALNEALTEREELNDRALTNAEEIRDLNEDLVDLEHNRLDLLGDQADAILELDALRSGETTRARELVAVENEIKNLTLTRRDAVRDIAERTNAIKTAEQAIRDADLSIRDANNQIRDAKITQALEVAKIRGDEQAINSALLARIGYNGTLISQSKELLTQSLLQNPAFLQGVLDKFNTAAGFGVKGLPLDAASIASLILNNPNKLLELLRRYVGGFAEGGLVTRPMLANIGEGSKHEMILPLSKPDRVWSLMSQHLPKYPGALRAAQTALGGSDIATLSKVVPSGHRVTRRSDGPATYGQIQELITLLREKKFEQHVQVPLHVESKSVDEDELIRKAVKRAEREIIKTLGRR